MKKNKMIVGRLLMVLGSLLILSGLLLLGYNHRLEDTASDASDATLLALQQEIEQNIAGDAQQPIELDGTQYLGVLNIPTLELTLPIQSDWSYKKLRSTPCVYSGSIQDGNLVLLAHNYRRHFGLIHSLRQGDSIQLTDTSGNTFQYLVEEVLVLNATDVDEMASSGYDLSLFTCTYGGKSRVTVRCTLQNEADRYPVIQAS